MILEFPSSSRPSAAALPASPPRRGADALRVEYRRLRALGLTARECEVVFWIAQGKRDAEIALIFGCAVRTVNKHVQQLLRKFRVHTRLAAARVARDWLQRAVAPADSSDVDASPADFADFARLRPLGVTPRQCEVLHLLALGHRDAEIGALLGLTPKSVSKHVEHLLRRFHAENRATVVSIALDLLRGRIENASPAAAAATGHDTHASGERCAMPGYVRSERARKAAPAAGLNAGASTLALSPVVEFPFQAPRLPGSFSP